MSATLPTSQPLRRSVGMIAALVLPAAAGAGFAMMQAGGAMPGAVWAAGAVGLMAGWAGYALDSWTRRLALLAAGSGILLMQAWLMGARGIAWQPASALTALGLGILGGGLLAPRLGKASAWFQGRLSREMLARLESVPAEVYQEPDLRETSILTARLLNETALREHLAAPEFLKLCERHRQCVAQVLLKHGALLEYPDPGTVRGYFGVPLAVENHAVSACTAALALEDALRDFAVDQVNQGMETPACGLGIASGALTAGVADGRYAAAGDAVEQSRWLCGLNAEYLTGILTDSNTEILAREQAVEFRPLEIMNPPEGAAVEVHQLLAGAGGLSIEARESRDAYRSGLLLLRAGHAADALVCFGQASSGMVGPDPVLNRFTALAEEIAARDSAATQTQPVNNVSEIPEVSLPPRTKGRRKRMTRSPHG